VAARRSIELARMTAPALFQKAPIMIVTNKHMASISKRIQILRDFKCSVFKYLIEIVVIYALAAIGFAFADEIRRGTYFGFYVSDDYATVAIDSRVETVNGTLNVPSYRDDFVK
jgi:hypothetical protein